MEDVFGTVLGEDAFHTVLLADGGDDGLYMEVAVVVCHIEADVVHRGFSLIDEDEVGWGELCHLTCHLAADGACGSSDEDALAFEHGAYGFHIDLNLLAGKEVFDLHFLELVVGEVGLAIPFFGLRHHHDFDAGFDEGGNECGTVGEAFGLDRRHEKDGDAFVNHCLNDFVVIVIDWYTKHPGAVHLLVTGDEAFELEAGRILGADTLGKGDAAGEASVDEDVAGGVGDTIGIVERLDDDAECAHDAGGNDEEQDGAVEVWKENVFVDIQMFLYDLEKADDQTGGGCGKSEPCKVHERAVTHHAPEGVVHYESDDEDYQAAKQSEGHRPEVLSQPQSSVHDICHQQAGDDHCGTVERQYAPVWQCIAREVPVTDSFDDIHICTFILSY